MAPNAAQKLPVPVPEGTTGSAPSPSVPFRITPEIAARVRTLRERLRLRQAELARLAGVAANTVSGLENARATHWRCVQRIAAALGTTPEALQRGEVSGVQLAKLTDEDLHVAELFHDAPTLTRLAILDLLRIEVNEDIRRILRLSPKDRRDVYETAKVLEETARGARNTGDQDK